MRNLYFKSLFLLTLILTSISGFGQYDNNVVIVVIDGARYSETFGDAERSYIPHMDQLSKEGTIIDAFYNDSITYTSRAIPALWCGTWTKTVDTTYNGHSTQYAVKPSIFEYYRKHRYASQNECYYVLKHISSLWLPSFDQSFGPDYWPTFVSSGSTDNDVTENAINAMQQEHPQLMWIYLAGVDHAGHSGNWDEYISAIENADILVNDIWTEIQSNPQYMNNTTMLVTNDHGRHDDQHGGFSGHGCGCEGCRHIMMLALGPNINKDFVSNQYRRIPDVAVTAAHLLDVDTEYATGNVMSEIFTNAGTSALDSEKPFIQITPNPVSTKAKIIIKSKKISTFSLAIMNSNGYRLKNFNPVNSNSGDYEFTWNAASLPGGIYFLQVKTDEHVYYEKFIIQ